MKNLFFLLFAFYSFALSAQTENDSIAKPITIDSLHTAIKEQTAKSLDTDERLSVIESELLKLGKIKFSGYLQSQYEMFDFQDYKGPVAGSNANNPITNSFFIRRARVKLVYETEEGMKFVIQPDYAFDKVTLRDAYVVVNDRWLHTFSLTAGQFNRLSYEVEFSSGTREFMERSRVTSVLYPQERDLGAKFEANFMTRFEIPLKVQFALFNGNFGIGTLANNNRDIDSNKDIMARIVYNFNLPSKGLGIDVGAHTYIGNTKILSQPVTNPVTAPAVFSDVNNNPFTPAVGDNLPRNWFGLETQVYYDFLGGTSFKAEYIKGTLSGTTNAPQANSLITANKVRDFEGFYLAFMKNFGKVNQLAIRYDVYDPNTNLFGSNVTKETDLKYRYWTFAWQYFYDENVKIVLGYNLPLNEKSDKVGGDYATANADRKDNTFTIRLQAKF